MAVPGVNSLSQEANFGALEPPSPQEPKPQGGALFTRREEKNEFSIQKGQEKTKKNASKLQITTATPEVKSQPQEAKFCALEPPYPL